MQGVTQYPSENEKRRGGRGRFSDQHRKEKAKGSGRKRERGRETEQVRTRRPRCGEIEKETRGVYIIMTCNTICR